MWRKLERFSREQSEVAPEKIQAKHRLTALGKKLQLKQPCNLEEKQELKQQYNKVEYESIQQEHDQLKEVECSAHISSAAHEVRGGGLKGFKDSGQCFPHCATSSLILSSSGRTSQQCCAWCFHYPHLKQMFFIILLFCTSCYGCGPDEYETNEMCCPMCPPARGLKTVKECTPSSDTVCGVLEGHYCIDADEGGCRAAHQHTACTPGQFIKHHGTGSRDTVCEDCPANTYSNGSSTYCKPHTMCFYKGCITIKPGNRTCDYECGRSFLPPILSAVLFIIFLVVILLRCKLQSSQNEVP